MCRRPPPARSACPASRQDQPPTPFHQRPHRTGPSSLRLQAGPFAADQIESNVDRLHNLIQSAAEADSFRTLDYGFTIEDFNNSFTTSLGGHVTYGLKSFIETRRASALAQLEASSIRPIILNAYFQPVAPSGAEPIRFFATALDDVPGFTVELSYSVNGESHSVSMFDDGLHHDGDANDGRYAVDLPAIEETTTLTFNFVATQADGRKSVTATREIQVGYNEMPLFVNELMASNDTTLSDELGEFDDWAEIFVGGESPISLDGLFFSDDVTNTQKWALPDTVVNPGDYVIVWLDGDLSQGALHADFKLSAGGEELVLFTADGQIIDYVSFGEQNTDVSYGRTADGAGRFEELGRASPGFANSSGVNTERAANSDRSVAVSIYPIPSTGPVTVEVSSSDRALTLEVFDILGRRIKYHQIVDASPSKRWHWDGTDSNSDPLAAGTYFLRIVDSRDAVFSTKSFVIVN